MKTLSIILLLSVCIGISQCTNIITTIMANQHREYKAVDCNVDDYTYYYFYVSSNIPIEITYNHETFYAQKFTVNFGESKKISLKNTNSVTDAQVFIEYSCSSYYNLVTMFLPVVLIVTLLCCIAKCYCTFQNTSKGNLKITKEFEKDVYKKLNKNQTTDTFLDDPTKSLEENTLTQDPHIVQYV